MRTKNINSTRIMTGVGAVLLISNAVQWVVSEYITISAWKTPPYNFAINLISDLGTHFCGTNLEGRPMCSPLHVVMNTSFICFGIVLLIASLFLSHLFVGRKRHIFIVLAVLFALGMSGVGFIPGSYESTKSGVGILHLLGAFIALLCGNILVIFTGLYVRNSITPRWYRGFCIVFGIFGLLGLLGVGLTMGKYPGAIFERISSDTILVWMFVTGWMLLWSRKYL